MAKNSFRPIPQFTVKIVGSGSAPQIMAELKALIELYEKDQVIPTGEMEGPALLVSIESDENSIHTTTKKEV